MSRVNVPRINRTSQAEVLGLSASVDEKEGVERARGRRVGAAASRQGWRLFSEDVRRGRFFAAVGLAFIVAGAVSFATSPEYTVASVTVQGSKVLSVEQANQIANVQGENIFLVDPQQVQARLAKEAALLKGVTVETLLPNSVIINVQERRPAVVWVLGDGTPLLASDDHVVVGNASTLDGLVTIFDRSPMTDALKIGAPMPVNKADAADTAQQIYLTLPAATGLQLRQLEWAPDNGITAITVTDQRIEFGTGDKLDQKIKIVQAALLRLRGNNTGWSQLDVRSVDRPTVTH
ncbi:MAG: FtsQ-type POTRA domain-containing protein [Chloroflexota bacterium]|nr:FtsQ-type POTRA domain-containing protein [Chloroflexota bacterium]